MMLRMRGADYHQADDDGDEHDEEHDDENDDDDDDDDDEHDDEIMFIIKTVALFFFIYVSSVPLDPTGSAEDAL